ncbi:MAG: NnrU family protein [Steroidobacter sp.]
MIYLIAGLLVFLGIHSVSIVAPNWRDATAARLGERPWKGLYAVISIASFVLLIWGYGVARMDPVVLYVPPPWTRWLAALLMLPVFPLLLAAYFPGRIQATLKHPMLAAVKFWALAHLLANGALADLLLFGGFLAWAVADRISFKRRMQRPVRGAPASRFNDAIAVVVGLALYFVFMNWLHVRWIGVSPMP